MSIRVIQHDGRPPLIEQHRVVLPRPATREVIGILGRGGDHLAQRTEPGRDLAARHGRVGAGQTRVGREPGPLAPDEPGRLEHGGAARVSREHLGQRGRGRVPMVAIKAASTQDAVSSVPTGSSPASRTVLVTGLLGDDGADIGDQSLEG